MAKPWGTVEVRVEYTRSLSVTEVTREKKGLVVSYPKNSTKDVLVTQRIPYSRVRIFAKRGLDTYSITYCAVEWTGIQSLAERPVLDEKLGLWRCKPYPTGSTYFVNNARFTERTGEVWTTENPDG